MWASTDKQDPVIITNTCVGRRQRQNDVTLIAIDDRVAPAPAAASSAAASSAGVTPAEVSSAG